MLIRILGPGWLYFCCCLSSPQICSEKPGKYRSALNRYAVESKKKDAYLLCLQKSTGLYNPCLVHPFHFGPAYSLFLPNTSYLSGFFAALFSEVVSHSFLNFYQTARLWKGRNSLLVSLHFSAARGSSPSPHFSVFIPGGPPPNEGCFFGLNCLFGA